METALEKRQRMISLYIVHTSMFVFALGNSVIMMGVWPYLQAVRKSIIYVFCSNSVLMKSNYRIYIMTHIVCNQLFSWTVPFQCSNMVSLWQQMPSPSYCLLHSLAGLLTSLGQFGQLLSHVR